MPKKHPIAQDGPVVQKRQKVEGKKVEKFASVSAIRAALGSKNETVLLQGLTNLRNQLNVKSYEDTLVPTDERIVLTKQWAEESPGLRELFDLWETSHPKLISFISPILSLLSNVLTLLSFHYTDYALGAPIIKTLLAQQANRRLNSYIGGEQAELILVTLKLYYATSTFGGGRERKLVLESFPWELKSLPKLFNMRRRGSDVSEPLQRPDIRTLYILVLLSFVDSNSQTQTKTAFLEQHRDAFLGIFKGLVQDHYLLARKILETCWTGLWLDPKIKRTLKVGLFNEATFNHLLKLYDRSEEEHGEAEHIPADLVHHFLLAISTNSGTGVCFRDRGWYPREGEFEAEEAEGQDPSSSNLLHRKGAGRIYNKILANVVKILKVNEDARQQELALKILEACPELIAGYWSAASLALEPRLSSKWITNISFFGRVISLPVPAASFILDQSSPNTPQSQSSSQYNPTPPPLSTILENILPTSNTKNNLTRGLQSPSALVQHNTALVLSKCLLKFQAVLAEISKISSALEESQEDGQWAKREREVAREVRKRVPEFQVLVAFSQAQQQKPVEPLPTAPSSENAPIRISAPNPAKTALLSEASLRLLWLYHKCFPAMVAEAKFDVGKLLQAFVDDETTADDATDTSKRFRQLQQLHTLNLLKESDQFVVTGRMSGLANNTPLFVLLRVIGRGVDEFPAVERAAVEVLEVALGRTILFQDDPEEVSLWIGAVPRDGRMIGDAAMLDDDDELHHLSDAAAVITFLDDCIQRAIKTPYRYIEGLRNLMGSSSSQENDTASSSSSVSPLLMAVLEQHQAKMNGKHLTPIQVLEVVCFTRKLLYLLSAKVSTTGMGLLQRVAGKVEEIVRTSWVFSDEETLKLAVRREVEMMRESLGLEQNNGDVLLHDREGSKSFHGFIQQLKDSSSGFSNQSLLSSSVAWLRLASSQTPLSLEQMSEFFDLLRTFSSTGAFSVLEDISPKEIDVTAVFNQNPMSNPISDNTFLWLFLHFRNYLLEPSSHIVILDSLFRSGVREVDVKRALNLISHSLKATENALQRKGLWMLLGKTFGRTRVLGAAIFQSLKETFFGNPMTLDMLMRDTKSVEAREGVKKCLRASLDPLSAGDRHLVHTIYQELILSCDDVVADADQLLVWIPYIESAELLGSLKAQFSTTPSLVQLCLQTLNQRAGFDIRVEKLLQDNLSFFLSLRETLPEISQTADEILSTTLSGCLPLCLDGTLDINTGDHALKDLLEAAKSRWLSQSSSIAELDISVFLQEPSFTPATATIISFLLYAQPSYRHVVLKWMADTPKMKEDVVLPILHTLLDLSISASEDEDRSAVVEVGTKYLSMTAKVCFAHRLPQLRQLAKECLLRLLSFGDDRATIFKSLTKQLKKIASADLNAEILLVGDVVASESWRGASDFMTMLVHVGLQWFIDSHAHVHDDDGTNELTRLLVKVISRCSITNAQLAETVLAVVIRSHLNHIPSLQLANQCAQKANLKPLVINRHLQSIVQHGHFTRLCVGSTAPQLAIRNAIIDFLHTLFHLHPNNTCQITHIEPLIRVYRGSLGKADLKILDILSLFESQRKLSTAPLLSRWSMVPDIPSESALAALRSLDATIVLKTAIAFPIRRDTTNPKDFELVENGESVYDPVFLLLLFGKMLQDGPPTSNVAWVELFRTNAVSLFIRALSSKQDVVRDLALSQLAGLWSFLENADLHEKPHVMYIFDVLKNLFREATDAAPRRLPSYSTLLLMHALRGVFYPSNFIYPETARFLLQRPGLDITDVPMLYGLLYSHGDDWKKDRAWILKFLSDGMTSTADWRVLKGRHTWDLLASLYQSSSNDQNLQVGVLEVLANLTCNPAATSSLLLKSSLLQWIEMQLLLSTSKGASWIRILENIILVVDAGKIEKATSGLWRATLCRCVSLLLTEDCPDAVTNFVLAAPTILRLSSIENEVPPGFADLLHLSFSCLQKWEATLPPLAGNLPHSASKNATIAIRPSHTVQPPPKSSTIEDWGSVVELLWQATMQLSDVRLWHQATYRLLVWRAMSGQECDIGEWARREVVVNVARKL